MSIVYNPPKSLEPFLTSEKFASFAVGPVGSGKTSAAVLKLAYHAKQMAKQKDGIRRSRAVWIRNTREQIRDTSLPSFLTWFPDGVAGSYLKTEMKFWLRFDDVECEVLFRGLDDADDVRRLLSMELSFAILDEAREINPDVFDALTARLGRYPSKVHGGCVKDDGTRNDHLWGATNPPDMDTYWEELFTNPPENTHVTFQPGAFEPEADWLQHLPDGYYENIAQGKTQDWIDVYINAKFGKSLSGKPVFRSFNRATHVAKNTLIFNPISENPLIVGMDTALHPAAVLCQLGNSGRLNVFHSIHAADMGALRFIREHLKPLLANRFGGARVVVVIDPAGMIRSQSDESTVADILRAEGLLCRPAGTNSIAARIAAVDSFLTRTVGGEPGILLDPEYNGELIQALAGKYRYRVKQNGETEEKPDKTRPWADLCFRGDTLVRTPSGNVRISDLRPGDVVLTPGGERRVLAAWCTGVKEVTEYQLSNGESFAATDGHPVFVENVGFIPVDELQYCDILQGVKGESWLKRLVWYVKNVARGFLRSQAGSPRGRVSTARKSVTGLQLAGPVSSSMANGFVRTNGVGITGVESSKVEKLRASRFTDMCGKCTTGMSRPGTIYTTGTTTVITTPSRTSKLCLRRSIVATTLASVLLRATKGFCGGLLQRVKKQPSGMGLTQVGGGTQSTQKSPGLSAAARHSHAQTAENNTKRSDQPENVGSVLRHARAPLGASRELTTSRGLVSYAEDSLLATNTPRQKLAVRLVGKKRCEGVTPVFNLQIEGEHMFYAGGVLVHNCDGLQYACLHADGGALFGRNVATSRKRNIIVPESRGWT